MTLTLPVVNFIAIDQNSLRLSHYARLVYWSCRIISRRLHIDFLSSLWQDDRIQPSALCGGTRSVFGADSAEKRCSCSRSILFRQQLSIQTLIYWALLRIGPLGARASFSPAGISIFNSTGSFSVFAVDFLCAEYFLWSYSRALRCFSALGYVMNPD